MSIHNGDSANEQQRLETLLQEFESIGDPRQRAMAVELVQVLMDLHGSGIARMLEILTQAGEHAIVEQFGNDQLVGQLLVLYDLHPDGLEQRVERALEKVRPMLQSHGGDVALVGIEKGVIRLQLEGNCNGCPSSSLTMKNLVEEAIYEFAADAAGLDVAGAEEPDTTGDFIPLSVLEPR